MYSLTRPLPDLPASLLLLWPLIYLQLVLLKAQIRRRYGRGVPYYYAISRAGRVSLHRLPVDACASAASSARLLGLPDAVRPGPCAAAGLIGRRVLQRLMGASPMPASKPGVPQPCRITSGGGVLRPSSPDTS